MQVLDCVNCELESVYKDCLCVYCHPTSSALQEEEDGDDFNMQDDKELLIDSLIFTLLG